MQRKSVCRVHWNGHYHGAILQCPYPYLWRQHEAKHGPWLARQRVGQRQRQQLRVGAENHKQRLATGRETAGTCASADGVRAGASSDVAAAGTKVARRFVEGQSEVSRRGDALRAAGQRVAAATGSAVGRQRRREAQPLGRVAHAHRLQVPVQALRCKGKTLGNIAS